MKVLKFGGTSVGSAAAIKSVLSIVEESYHKGDLPLVVCSAMSGVTNQLISMAHHAAGQLNYQDLFQEVTDRHLQIIDALHAKSTTIHVNVKILFSALERLLEGLSIVGELSPRSADKIMSFGERLSCTIISSLLQEMNVPAVFTDARNLLLTDSNFGKASLIKDKSYENIRQWAAQLQAQLPVVTGFIAADAQKRTTTLGRGGSDYTAAIFGAALQAEEVQIWTDVNGFMTADPRLVKNAFTLEEISYKEAMELSYFGAKVIYPPSLIPAITANIPIRIKNTFYPEEKGTSILPEIKRNGRLIRGISSVGQVSLINIEGNGMVGLKGFGGKLFSSLADANVNIILITQASSEHSISFAIAPEETEAAVQAITNTFRLELLTNIIEPPQVNQNLSILAVVGENMRQTKGVSAKLFKSLGRSGVNVVAIAQGSSELNISVVIAQDDLSKALNAVHDALFLSQVKTRHLFLAGTGNIGSELIRQLQQAQNSLFVEQQLQLKVMALTNSRMMWLGGPDGLHPELLENQTENQAIPADMDQFMAFIEAANLPNAIFVDNTSNPDLVNYYERLFEMHVSVVACNKLGASGSMETYQRLKANARKHGVSFLYETNVGAGLPIIKTMQDLLISGDRFLKIEAILSGTISYIFNNYKGELSFADVVRHAQLAGYTEPDPRDDLNGKDFARKMLILARETAADVEMEDIVAEQILPESCLNAPDIDRFYLALQAEEAVFAAHRQAAESSGKTLRFIGTFEHGKISINLKMVAADHPFYNMNGSDNIIAFTTERYKETPLVIKGPGAGAAVTAAGVFADILRVASFE